MHRVLSIWGARWFCGTRNMGAKRQS
jgi:hypothetical protein